AGPGRVADRRGDPRPRTPTPPGAGTPPVRPTTEVSAAVADDPGPGFDEVYRRHFQPLVVQLYAFVGDMGEAQDLVQEAFSRAWPRWHRIARYDDPVAWVRRVAWNVAVSRWRRLRTARLFGQRQRPEVVAGPGPERVVLAAALATLPANQRRLDVRMGNAGTRAYDSGDLIVVLPVEATLDLNGTNIGGCFNQGQTDDTKTMYCTGDGPIPSGGSRSYRIGVRVNIAPSGQARTLTGFALTVRANVAGAFPSDRTPADNTTGTDLQLPPAEPPALSAVRQRGLQPGRPGPSVTGAGPPGGPTRQVWATCRPWRSSTTTRRSGGGAT
ncbi:sigma factor, partial [Micromonospora yasonensis]|uniref:sigma factor n=1 Tax=Micromonospora yasonensis TaxID=1128667 RepID=UPI0029F4FEB9